MPRDPVCGMEVDEKTGIKLEKDGKVYYFCSESDRDKFIAQAGEEMPEMTHGEHQMKPDMHAGHAGHMAGGGHASHHAHMVADFRKRFWISLILTLPILVLSPMIQKFLGLREVIRFTGDMYVLFGFSSIVFF